MYDWANSVYSLVINTAIFPIYYFKICESQAYPDPVTHEMVINLLGFKAPSAEFLTYAYSLSYLIISILSPILSGIADYSGRKKAFMRFFVLLGSLSCISFYFFNANDIAFGLLMVIFASVGFSGSLVFYNAFLPEIVTPDRYDKTSAKGYALGYIGSVLLLIVNLVMVSKPQWFLLPDAGTATRISFLMVGLWWLGFSQYTFYYLPKESRHNKIDNKIITKGFKELKRIWFSLRHLPEVRRYLQAYFFYDMGTQTIMLLATTFIINKLNIDKSFLIVTVLVIQLVAIPGAYFFAFISKKRGNIFSIRAMILIWIMVCIAAYFVNDNPGDIISGQYQFLIIAVIVGIIMGGIQSLSRATYAKLLPATLDHASYFSFYDVIEKTGLILGPLSFGVMQALTGDISNSVWPLMVFFIIGYILLSGKKWSEAAGVLPGTAGPSSG